MYVDIDIGTDIDISTVFTGRKAPFLFSKLEVTQNQE